MKNFKELKGKEKVIYVISAILQIFILLWVITRPINVLIHSNELVNEMLVNRKAFNRKLCSICLCKFYYLCTIYV